MINDQSQLIRLDDLASTSPLPNNLPVVTFAPGRRPRGTEGMTARDFIGYDHGMHDRRGLLSLAAVEEVAVVLVPDAMLAYNRMSVPEARGFVQRIP